MGRRTTGRLVAVTAAAALAFGSFGAAAATAQDYGPEWNPGYGYNGPEWQPQNADQDPNFQPRNPDQDPNFQPQNPDQDPNFQPGNEPPGPFSDGALLDRLLSPLFS